jgi:RimJ/RimL family protein N-acetyltransferase
MRHGDGPGDDRLETATYLAIERLRDGRRIQIRAQRPEDHADLLAAVSRTSAKSLYRRFFTVKRRFSERETSFFLNVDFANHVALVAVVDEAGRPAIAGGARYIVVEPGSAEVAFVVIDAYQGQGVGTLLLRHLTTIARAAGLKQFVADVLAENGQMQKVFQRSGLPLTSRREEDVMHIVLNLG